MARIIEDNLLQELVTYLSSRPYIEVHKALPALVNLPEVPAPAEAPQEKDKE